MATDSASAAVDHQAHEQEMKWQELLQTLEQNLLSLRAAAAESWGQATFIKRCYSQFRDCLMDRDRSSDRARQLRCRRPARIPRYCLQNAPKHSSVSFLARNWQHPKLSDPVAVYFCNCVAWKMISPGTIML